MGKIIPLYKNILDFASMQADEKGYVNLVLSDTPTPAVIEEARLVIPISEQLKNLNPNEKKIFFHPLMEDIMKGESEVIKYLKKVINVKLNITLGSLFQNLLHIAASPEYHGKFNPDQTELLMKVKGCDEKSVNNFMSVLREGAKEKPDSFLVNIFLKKGGSVSGKKYSRAGIVVFPYFQELLKDNKGKLRVKDVETYIQLFKYMLPEIDQEEGYNCGSSSRIAPFLDALMKTAGLMATRLNDVTELFKDYIPDHEKLLFNSDWYEDFQNLDLLESEIRRIPKQSSDVVQEEPVEDIRASAASYVAGGTRIPVAPSTSRGAPAPEARVEEQSPIVHTNRGIDFESSMRNLSRIRSPYPVQQPYQQPYQPQPQFQQPQVQAQPAMMTGGNQSVFQQTMNNPFVNPQQQYQNYGPVSRNDPRRVPDFGAPTNNPVYNRGGYGGGRV